MKAWKYVGVVISVVVIASCEVPTGTGPTPPEPSRATPAPTPVPPPAASSARSVGCFTAANVNAPTMCGLIGSFGNPLADQGLFQEVGIQRGFWSGIPVRSVAVMNDCGPDSRNAKADPVTRDIYFGYYMFNTLVAQHGNTLPAAGVLAHEWGHQVQFSFQWISNPVRPMELEADAFSGFYMALAKGWAWSYMNTYFQAVYGFGDTNFSSPGHHGTPDERLAMARVGFDTAVQAASLGRPLSYPDLHLIFYQSISRLRFATTDARIADPVLVDLADRVASGEAAEIAAGRSRGSEGRVPGSHRERQRYWPNR
jgi:hypothetical protein